MLDRGKPIEWKLLKYMENQENLVMSDWNWQTAIEVSQNRWKKTINETKAKLRELWFSDNVILALLRREIAIDIHDNFYDTFRWDDAYLRRRKILSNYVFDEETELDDMVMRKIYKLFRDQRQLNQFKKEIREKIIREIFEWARLRLLYREMTKSEYEFYRNKTRKDILNFIINNWTTKNV